MKLAGKTDVGRVRQENQDDYRAGELPGGAVWALVCDGTVSYTHLTLPTNSRV